MRKLALLVGAIFLIGSQIPTLIWGYRATIAQEKMRRGEEATLSSVTGGPAPMRWWSRRADLSDTFNTSFLSDDRHVQILLRLPFEDLLAPDEPMPEDVFKNAFAAARAPAHLITLCPELLSTIAVKCDVSRPAGRVGADGLAEVSGALRFVPADAPGTLPQTENADFLSLPVALTQNLELPFTRAGRERALSVARALCRALRDQAGNCVITRVVLEPVAHTGAGGIERLEARAVLTIYADPSQVDRQALKNALAQASRRIEL